MATAEATHCPVCRAPFRSAAECPRCGADLGPLMTTLVQAWSLRQGARRALRAGHYRRAVGLAEAADGMHPTRTSQALRHAAELLYRATHRR